MHFIQKNSEADTIDFALHTVMDVLQLLVLLEDELEWCIYQDVKLLTTLSFILNLIILDIDAIGTNSFYPQGNRILIEFSKCDNLAENLAAQFKL